MGWLLSREVCSQYKLLRAERYRPKTDKNAPSGFVIIRTDKAQI
jgi:hypothetical protein